MKKRLLSFIVASFGLATIGLSAQTKTITVDGKVYETIEAAAQDASLQKPIKLSAHTFELSEQLVIEKEIAIEGILVDGKGTTIIPAKEFKDPAANDPDNNQYRNLISIEGATEGAVRIANLAVTGSKAAGINAISKLNVTLENVNLNKNKTAGLLVHCSVEARGLHTSENTWGGVNVDTGKPAYTPSFSFDANSTFRDTFQIWSEATNDTKWVKTPANAGWRITDFMGGKDNKVPMNHWTNRNLTTEVFDKFPGENKENKFTFIYANGQPITIEQGSTVRELVIKVNATGEILKVDTAQHPVIFGGAKNEIVTSSSITMKSGIVRMMFGGGYGTRVDSTATVTGATSINISGGIVTNSLFGGGLHYAKSSNVDINLSNASVGGTSNWVMCGGKESGVTTGTPYKDFNNSVKTATLTINGGTYGLIALGGTDGDKGRTGQTTATIKDAIIKGGVYGNGSNGCSDKVVGTLTNCKFIGKEMEIAAINRGIAESISISFEGCNFPTTGLYANLGATYHWAEGYAGSKAEGKDITFSFNKCINAPFMGISDGLENANVTLTGAQAKLDKFERNKDEVVSSFTQGTGTTWTFNNGLEQRNEATLTSEGTINTIVANAYELKVAAAWVNKGTISLGTGITLGKQASEHGLTFNEGTTLDGRSNTITLANDFALDTNNAWRSYALSFLKAGTSAGFSIKNLTLNSNNKGNGIKLFNAKNVVLENVSVQNSLGVGLLVVSSTAKASNLNTSGNAWGGVNVDKSSDATITESPSFTFESGTLNEKPAIYSDYTGSVAEDKVAKYVTFPNGGWKGQALEGGKKYVWIRNAIVPTISGLKASNIEAGQPLSSSILNGGKAMVGKTEIGGVFTWKAPATVAKEGLAMSYDVVFTPSDLETYAIVETKAAIEEAIQYYQVTTEITPNGKVAIKEVNTANKYRNTKVLTLEYRPDANYELDGTHANSHTVSKDAVLTAKFKQITHKVSFNIVGIGNVKVMNGETALSTGAIVAQGTVLSVLATPGTSSQLSGLTNNGTPISSTVTVNGDLNILAAFAPIPEEHFTVQVKNTIKNGKLILADKDKNTVNSGSSVKKNTELFVTAMPDKGYTLKDGKILVDEKELKDNKFTVTKNASISAAFDLEKYAVTTKVVGATIKIKKDGTDVTDLTAIDFGTVLTAEATAETGYKLNSLVVNGKEIPNKGSFTVTDATQVVATAFALSDIVFNDEEQTVTYDGTAKQYIVKTMPAGLSGFTVTYTKNDGTPVAGPKDADTYTVKISRDADDTYKAVKEKELTFKIAQAEMKDVVIPTWNSTSNEWEGSDGGAYSDDNKDTEGIYQVTFKPTSGNYKEVVFSTYKKESEATKVTLNTKTRAGDPSLTIKSTGGTVQLLNGTVPATSFYVGQVLTIACVPNQGNSTNAAVKANGTDAKVITLEKKENIIDATFAAKEAPKSPTYSEPTNPTYTGSPIVPTVTASNGWIITIEKDKMVVDPTNVGEYIVWASHPEDGVYSAVTKKELGRYTIAPKILTLINEQGIGDLAVISTTTIQKGQALAQSTIAGKAPVDGTFSWKEPETVAVGDNSDDLVSKSYVVVFEPASANYKVSGDKELKSKVAFYSAVNTSRTLSFAPATNGTFKVKVNGAEVVTGAAVSKGDKVKVEATPATGYTASISVSGATLNNSEYIVGETGNVVVKVTFTGDAPYVDVISVALDKATLSLAIKGTYTLKATINPTNATNQDVTWKSSDEKIATVDATGKVTAVAAGKATITVTTDNGKKTATCVVTVAAPTGIEELANTRVYGSNGAIFIEPAMPVNALVVTMTGHVLYNSLINSTVQVPATSGIYIVKLSAGGNTSVKKVSVR